MQTFLSRFARLRRLPGLVGLFAVAWAIAETIHTGSFIVEFGGGVKDFFSVHPTLACVAAILWLLAWMAWPDIKRVCPAWLRFQTLHGKVHDLIHSHSELKAEVATLSGGCLDTLSTISTLATKQMVASESASIREEVKEARQSASVAINRLDEHRPWISEIERATSANYNAIARVLSNVQSYTLALLDVNTYFSEALQLSAMFREMRERYGTLSPAVTTAFHYDWRPPSRSVDPVNDAIRDGERWAKFLERHITEVQALCMRLGVPFFTGELYTYVPSWRVNRRDTSSDDVSKLLDGHAGQLRELRESYAAKLAGAEKASATTS